MIQAGIIIEFTNEESKKRSEDKKLATVEVLPGICGLKTKLIITADEEQLVQVEIHSECPLIAAMQKDLKNLDGYSECFAKYSSSTVYSTAEKNIKHLACPVPTAIIKGMEVACGLALPKNVAFVIEKS
jgi:hypothetical protein